MISNKPTPLQTLYSMVDEILRPASSPIPMDKSQKEALQKQSKLEQECRLSATDGSIAAREHVLNRIYENLNSLKEYVFPENIDDIILQYHINYFANIYSGGNTQLLKAPIDKKIELYFEKYSISPNHSYSTKLRKLAQIIYQELYGFSLLDELVFDSELNEVACNRHDYIWIQYMGIKKRIPNPTFKFSSEEFYKRVIENRITATAREEMNAGEPFINCTLKNGFRVTAARPPLSKHYVVSIRLFIYHDIKTELRNRFMEDRMLKLIKTLATKGRRNIAIIGEQGSGKTTASDELIIKNLDENTSIGLAEYTHELNISSNHPDKNVVELQYGKDFQPSNITEMFFRFNRDIIIYGEVRSPQEAFEMIKAMLRQARGSLFTFHSSSVRRMIHDLRQLLMQTGYYTDFREAQFDVSDAVDIVIHISLDRATGVRYVSRICEVSANEQDMSFCITDLFVYNKEKQNYLVNRNGLSNTLIQSCMEYEMSSADVIQLSSIFSLTEQDSKCFEYLKESEEH